MGTSVLMFLNAFKILLMASEIWRWYTQLTEGGGMAEGGGMGRRLAGGGPGH